MPTSDAVLAVEDLQVAYGHVVAVAGVSLHVGPQEMVALLGANGAGKTTLLHAISGLLRPRSGEVRLGEERIDRLPARAITRRGVVQVPEGRMVVAPLSVEDNLLLAARASRRRRGDDIGDGLEEVYDLFPNLRERRRQPSGLLSGGEQQMLALGRGIMARPEVLLVDEPSMGLAPIIIEELYELLRDRKGTLGETAILLAEQSSTLALSVADRVTVMARGVVTHTGPAADIDEETMMSAYLGLAGPATTGDTP